MKELSPSRGTPENITKLLYENIKMMILRGTSENDNMKIVN